MSLERKSKHLLPPIMPEKHRDYCHFKSRHERSWPEVAGIAIGIVLAVGCFAIGIGYLVSWL